MKSVGKRARSKEKTEQFPLRLDPTTKAQVELYSRVAGISSNTFLKEAAIARIKTTTQETGVSWAKFGERPTVPGWRECLMFVEPGGIFRLNTEEEAIREFVLDYKPFFFRRENRPNAENLKQLWPNLDRYMALTGPGKPVGRAAEAMAADLRAVGLPVPTWSPADGFNEDDDQGARQEH